MTPTYIFGAGGSGREVAWLARQVLGDSVELIFLVDDDEYVTEPVHGVHVRNVADALSGGRYVVAIGDTGIRKKAVQRCEQAGLEPTTLVHPRVERSCRVDIDAGSIIGAGSVLTTDVHVGKHVHINVGCTVSHDVRIGDYATLSPGVHVSGWVTIEEGVSIGTGANVINGSSGTPLVIGAGAIIAAGACIVNSVPSGALMTGVPAVRKR